MSKILFAATILSLSVLSLINAQTTAGVCGTVGDLQEAFIPDLRENLRRADQQYLRLRSTQYFPIKFHIITETDGTKGIRESRVLDQLTKLNEDFADLNIQFYLEGGAFNYINNSVVYKDHEATIGTIMKANRHPRAINVFIPENVDRRGGGEGRTLGYYLKIAITNTGVFESDWIAARQSEVQGNSITLTHELGHYFTLAHPHRGWDSEPYDPDLHGNPVQQDSPSGIPTELQDGSNCNDAGDLLCDTPPDYNFGFTWTRDCNYAAGTMDPKGREVNPEERLFMSYFSSCPSDSYFFSDMQKAAIIASAGSSKRDYIRTDWTPQTIEINESPTLEFPIDDEILAYFNDINFKWSAVAGANKYLLEISRLPTFVDGDFTISLVVNGNSKVVNGLEADRKYYWRVRPYNEYVTNTEFTSHTTFRTGTTTATDEPEFIDEWALSPNPVSIGQTVQLTINSQQAFSGQISWYTMNGQRIKTEVQQRFVNGAQRLSLSTDQLSAGLYLLVLETQEGRLTKRLAVLP